jgi:hypothetical protein
VTLFAVPSGRAEVAAYRVNEILAAYRLRAGADDSTDAAVQAAYEAIHQLITVAEMYAGEHLVETVEARLPEDELVLRLWERRSDQIVRDWRGRRDGWNELFKVSWSNESRHKRELEAWIMVRNIAAHGLGRLTMSNLRRGAVKRDVVDKLTLVGVRLRGHELIVTARNVERCARRVTHFIFWLDDAVHAALGPVHPI